MSDLTRTTCAPFWRVFFEVVKDVLVEERMPRAVAFLRYDPDGWLVQASTWLPPPEIVRRRQRRKRV